MNETICPECAATMRPDQLRDLVSEQEFSEEADAAAKELMDYMGEPTSVGAFRELMKLCHHVLNLCVTHGLHPASLAGRVAFLEWSRGANMDHMAECADDDCDWACCRRARGWSEENIRVNNERRMRKRRSRNGKAKRRKGGARRARA